MRTCVHPFVCACTYVRVCLQQRDQGSLRLFVIYRRNIDVAQIPEIPEIPEKEKTKRRRGYSQKTANHQPSATDLCVNTLLQSLTFLKYKPVLFCFLIINKSYEKTKTSNQHAPSCCFTCTILHCIQIKEENKVFLYLLNTRVLAFFKDETMYW